MARDSLREFIASAAGRLTRTSFRAAKLHIERTANSNGLHQEPIGWTRYRPDNNSCIHNCVDHSRHHSNSPTVSARRDWFRPSIRNRRSHSVRRRSFAQPAYDTESQRTFRSQQTRTNDSASTAYFGLRPARKIPSPASASGKPIHATILAQCREDATNRRLFLHRFRILIVKCGFR